MIEGQVEKPEADEEQKQIQESWEEIKEIFSLVELPKLSQGQLKPFIFFAEKDDQKVLIPLKKVDIKSELRGAIVVSSIELTYYNPNEEKNALECTYLLPLQKTTILNKFEAQIDGKTIETKVVAK